MGGGPGGFLAATRCGRSRRHPGAEREFQDFADANGDARASGTPGYDAAFWGAEEFGLIGSEYYVSQLSTRELKDIAVNLNFDMVDSSNDVRFV